MFSNLEFEILSSPLITAIAPPYPEAELFTKVQLFKVSEPLFAFMYMAPPLSTDAPSIRAWLLMNVTLLRITLICLVADSVPIYIAPPEYPPPLPLYNPLMRVTLFKIKGPPSTRNIFAKLSPSIVKPLPLMVIFLAIKIPLALSVSGLNLTFFVKLYSLPSTNSSCISLYERVSSSFKVLSELSLPIFFSSFETA